MGHFIFPLIEETSEMAPNSEARQTRIFECEFSRLHFAQYSTTIYTRNSFDDSKCLFDVGNVHY